MCVEVLPVNYRLRGIRYYLIRCAACGYLAPGVYDENRQAPEAWDCPNCKERNR